MAKRKDKMMKEYLARPVQIGDKIVIPRHYVSFRNDLPPNSTTVAEIVEINDSTYTVSVRDYYKNVEVPISECKPYTLHVGINPFPDLPWERKMQRNAFSLDGILSVCGITWDSDYQSSTYKIEGFVVPELNWNPYVIKDGERHYYQRDLCWNLSDERSFIDSIYNSIQCGTIILRRRSWKWLENEIKSGNTDVAFRDIVDGKQRMNTLRRFLNDEFTDSNGNYWSDLSELAQYKFIGTQSLGFAELQEDATDEDVLQSFLSINYCGKPMSKQHIKYVREIAQLFQK